MTDSLIDKYARRPTTATDEATEPETDDLGCFGWLRGVRDRSIMLELRRKDGHVMAVGYSWIERVELVPESGIVVHLPGRKITISGSGLRSQERGSPSLFDGLIRHRVPWIRESDHAELAVPRHIIIDSISWDE